MSKDKSLYFHNPRCNYRVTSLLDASFAKAELAGPNLEYCPHCSLNVGFSSRPLRKLFPFFPPSSLNASQLLNGTLKALNDSGYLRHKADQELENLDFVDFLPGIFKKKNNNTVDYY